MTSLRHFTMVILAAFTFTACTIKSADDDPGVDAGAGGAAGQGGTGGQGGTSPPEDCPGVPPTGACVSETTLHLCLVPDDEFSDAFVREETCPDGWKCVTDRSGARCENQATCIEGDSRCFGTQTLETCDAGQWVASACGGEGSCQAGPGLQAQCVQMASGGTTYPLSGVFQYEYRSANSDMTGVGDIKVRSAYYMMIAAWTGDEYVGAALTDAEGKFTIELSKPATADTIVFAFPMSFNYDTGQPLNAIALPPEPDPQDGKTSPQYWSYAYPGAIAEGTTELGEWIARESEGSGAIHIFQWLEYGFYRMHTMYPDVAQKSAITWWKPGVKFDCGACFWSAGGFRVELGTGDYDYYDTRFQFSGADEGPKHWMASSVGHEFGHYVMYNYSVTPGEGGSHSSSQANRPGLAYSEGWATFFGQRNMSEGDALEPVYFSVGASGTYWFWDLDKSAEPGSRIPKADPTGPIDQYISEGVVTYMLWHMWAPQGDHPPYKALGDAPIFGALVSERVTNDAHDRGYSTVDYVDFADALLCADAGHRDAVLETAEPIGYPYHDADKLCP